MTSDTCKRPGRPLGSPNKKRKDSIELTATDICDIIRLCGEKNVLSFSYRDLSVNFNTDTHVVEKTNIVHVDPADEKKQSLQRRHDSIEEDLDYMKITDPVAFEALAMEGETVEEDSKHS
jgi:hypothetical protein